MEAEILTVIEREAGMRLDQFLICRFPDYSRAYFQTLIKDNLVLVNSECVKKATKLEEGDEIEIEFAATSEISIHPEPIPLAILYEDDHLLAINKPPGMVVHPAVGNWTGTFVNALLYHCTQLTTNDSLRPGIVHRLDKETSGLLLAAKDDLTHRRLVEAFALRNIHKEYLAISIGNPGKQQIVGNIGRHPVRRKEMAVLNDKGKAASTSCETIIYNESLSLVKLLPYTGRTHQLRIHMKSIGFPILGDGIYGSVAANKKFGAKRQLLHAYHLRFLHPITKKEIELKAPIPEDMNKFIQYITNQRNLSVAE
ncbi:MAG TPA: RluA family pseudouridine synthase [Waddliaceae bacterium]